MAPCFTMPNPDFLENRVDEWITFEGSSFMANGHSILSEVLPNILVTPTSNLSGCFVGFNSKVLGRRHAESLGKLKAIKFMSIFRFNVWWTTHWVGTKGGDVENETQMMLLDRSDQRRPYVLLLPIIEGPFRTSLQGRNDDNLEICVESGPSQVTGSSFRSVLYMHVGDDPYKLVKEAMKVVRVHLGTFKLLEEKTPPRIVDKFGWCRTWDAFYLKVNPEGVLEGVKTPLEDGCPPGQGRTQDFS